MDKITAIFDKEKKIKAIRKVSVNTIGMEETEQVWKEARSILKELLYKYPTIQRKEERHVDLIFSHIALYKSLLRNHSEQAMQIMEEGEAVTAKESGKLFQKMVSIPFGKTMFFKVFSAGCKSGFGSDAGFANTVHNVTNKEYRMDVTMCPYVKYCDGEGCSELTHIFCDNDIYAYGCLKGIRFTRTETLGTGGNKCDFWFTRE